jgi:hypothetical protein
LVIEEEAFLVAYEEEVTCLVEVVVPYQEASYQVVNEVEPYLESYLA